MLTSMISVSVIICSCYCMPLQHCGSSVQSTVSTYTDIHSG